MKDSARYNQLLSDKMKELSLGSDANQAWTQMEGLLNQQMPINDFGGTPSAAAKTSIMKLSAGMTYVIPVTIALISVATWVLIRKQPIHTKKHIVKQFRQEPRDTTARRSQEELFTDTVSKTIAIADSLSRSISFIPPEDSLVFGMKSIMKDVPLTKVGVKAENDQVSKKSMREELEPVIAIGNDKIVKKVTGYVAVQSSDSVHAKAALSPGFITSEDDKIAREDEHSLVTLKGEKQRKNKNVKIRKIKPVKVKNNSDPNGNVFGLEAGLNTTKYPGPFIAAFGNVELNDRFSLTGGVQLNSEKNVISNYQNVRYPRVDTVPEFSFSDSRKLVLIDIPVTLNYRLAKRWAVSAGPLMSFALKRSASRLISKSVNADTLISNSLLDSLIRYPVSNRVNFGIRSGISYRMRSIEFGLQYNWFKAYEFKNELGSSKALNHSFQVGLRYWIK